MTRLHAMDALRQAVRGGTAYLAASAAGISSGRLFRRHAEPAEVPPGADLSYLLDTEPRFDVGIGQ